MTLRHDKLGRVKISPAAIAALVAETVKECYGVVGMSNRGRLSAAMPRQRGRYAQRGIEISEGEHGVIVDIYVVVEYGTRVTEVAAGVMRRVYFQLTQGAGLPVQAVNIHVHGLRVSEDNDGRSRAA